MKIIFLTLLMAVAIWVVAFVPKGNTVLTGKIVNEQANGIAGATILLKGTSNQTVSDNNGAFTINALSEKATIVVSMVGYVTRQLTVTSKAPLVVQLKSSTIALQEIVITDYDQKQTILVNQAQKRMFQMAPAADAYGYLPPSVYKTYRKRERIADSIVLDREGYDRIIENPFLAVKDNPLSTFSIDVDAASYSNVRRMINSNQLPPAGAVRIEEMINYFTYEYPQPADGLPFSVNTEIATCPWNSAHRLVSIGLQGKKIDMDKLPPSNLTFLIDVSGSMQSPDKLPLVKTALKLLVNQLREQDIVSLVVYAGSAGLVLKPTSGSDKIDLASAIDNLEAGGATAGGQGIELAYATAAKHLNKNGNNRVILCTDGDFNIGISSDDELERLIEAKRRSGIFLTVLGFGTGNYQDAKMQKLADKGNGNHAYIDNAAEAKKVLVSEFGGTLFTIAKDVKLQIEFNPALVKGYRLIGYENRLLAKEDFNNDVKDAGDLGSGHTVTALYEIVPAGASTNVLNAVDPLRYQQPVITNKASAFTGETMNIKLRYKQADSDVSRLLVKPVTDSEKPIDNATENMRFATAVAQYGMLLTNSTYKGTSTYNNVVKMATNAFGEDVNGYRKEFVSMVKKTATLEKKAVAVIDKGE